MDGPLDAGFEVDEFLELGGEVGVVGFEVAFAAGEARDDLFDVAEVFVEFVGFFADFDEAFVGLVHLAEGVDECVGEVVEDAGALFGHG